MHRPRQTPLTQELLDYIESNFNAEDDFLKTLVKDSWEKNAIPQINITGYQANFLQFLVRVVNAKNILEIGTLAGYSAIAMARATSDGKILSIEKEEKHYNYASEKVKEAGLADRITIINQNAKEYLQKNPPSTPIDLLFLDADKNNYINYLKMLKPYIKKGGIVVADNAFAFGFLLDAAPEKTPDRAKSMLSFHKQTLQMPDFFTTIVPLGDGMLLSVKTSCLCYLENFVK